MQGTAGEGTTFNYSDYLTKVSPAWKDAVGEGKSVQWPDGVGGKGNEGVASYVQQIDGSIGYVALAYALQNKMAYAMMRNAAGNFLAPPAEAFPAAAATADWHSAHYPQNAVVGQSASLPVDPGGPPP